MHSMTMFLAGLTLFCALATAIPTTATSGGSRFWVYVTSKSGVLLFKLDSATGTLEPAGSAAPIGSDFLAFSPDGQFAYATNSTTDANKKRVGEVLAFSVDGSGGALTLLNRQPPQGEGPCFITVDPQGKNALVANYSSATVAVFPLAADGKLGEASCVIKQTGSSVDPSRQTRAYAHSVNVDPTGKFAFVPDLGADKLFIYKFDSARGLLTPNDPPAMTVPPGSGPRHLAFDPSGKFIYLVTEMIGSVVVYANDSTTGNLKQVQVIGTLPADFKGTNTSSEIQVHPSGKFLYASNRGDSNFITIFSIDQVSGKLTLIGYQPTLGKTPRNFRIDPSGRYLIAANQDSDSIVLFSIEQSTGKLTPVGNHLSVPRPMCVKFMPMR